MLDLGFIDDILKVAEYLPAQRQNMLFSATYSQSIKQLADELLDRPRRIEVARRNIAADAVAQAVYPVERIRKREMLSHLIRKGEWQQVLVFARTRYGADKLTAELLFDGIKAAAIHSNKSQSVRTRTLAEFKRGELRVLVATDVAARGLDIQRLPHVVNYDLPQVPEDYVHRIGRTGRAGEDGVALSLVCQAEQPLLVAIEKLLKYAIPRQTIAEFPQIAVKRGMKTKPAQKSAGPSKSRKTSATPAKAAAPSRSRKTTATPAKAAAPAPGTTPRRKKAVSERPGPKTGRRGHRS
jgi:ATP-dependent RNA helicase RhlE